MAKSRIDSELKRQAEAVLEEIGLKPRAALELFYKQIIKRRALPFPVLMNFFIHLPQTAWLAFQNISNFGLRQ